MILTVQTIGSEINGITPILSLIGLISSIGGSFMYFKVKLKELQENFKKLDITQDTIILKFNSMENELSAKFPNMNCVNHSSSVKSLEERIKALERIAENQSSTLDRITEIIQRNDKEYSNISIRLEYITKSLDKLSV